ncbi:hypothetical protein [Roseateles sp. P5_E7]
MFQHYPQLRPAQVNAAQVHDLKLYEQLIHELNFDPAIRLLRDHDFGGAFLRTAIQPLYDFYETWDQPQREFVDADLQAGLKELYEAGASLSLHLVGKTVPVGAGGQHASVFSDQLRAQGVRPAWVLDEARVLNEEARKFVPLYENFVRRCRVKLVGG